MAAQAEMITLYVHESSAAIHVRGTADRMLGRRLWWAS